MAALLAKEAVAFGRHFQNAFAGLRWPKRTLRRRRGLLPAAFLALRILLRHAVLGVLSLTMLLAFAPLLAIATVTKAIAKPVAFVPLAETLLLESSLAMLPLTLRTTLLGSLAVGMWLMLLVMRMPVLLA